MSAPDDRVVLWCGKKLDEMTREELLEAFQQLANVHRLSQEWYSHMLACWKASLDAIPAFGLDLPRR